MKIVQKVKEWAESKKGGSRFVSGDTSVTYEDILSVCELAKSNSPDPVVTTPKKRAVNNGKDDLN